MKPHAFALALNRKWRDRFEQEGPACGSQARGPNCCASRSPEVIERIKSLRRQRMPGKEIALTVGVLSSGQPHVQASGLSKLSALEAADLSAQAAGPPAGDHRATPI